jgi:spore coat protein A
VLGKLWDDITENPRLLDTEVWRFINRSGMTHPMHMHLVMFQVLDRQTFDDSGGTIVPTGPLVPPAAYEAGWKDTVQVAPGEMVRVIARFEGYEGLYAYHCHILEHEDHEMMRQFLVPEPSELAMLLAGGVLMGVLARRRRAHPA